ncbi:MAG: DUF2125 domain-containing protein [Rhodospirillales bacterium]|jgi:hypothetical protein|nr:DUF2125 domain-containing protein [Rhodospirillales bacterium]
MDILEPDTKLIKRHLGWGVAILAAVVVLWSVYWNIAAAQAVNGARNWASNQQKSGYKINWQQIDTSGYPFFLDIDVLMLVVEARDEWRWSTDKLQFHASLWEWSEIDVFAPSSHSIFLSRGAKLHTYDLSSKSLNAHIVLNDEKIQNVNVHATALSLQEEERPLGGVDSGQLRLEIVTTDDADYSTLVGTLEGRFQGIEITELSDFPLGSDISRLSLRTELFGAPPSTLNPDDLSIWRDLGGVVELRHLNLGYGALEIETSGTMALDGKLQPIGSLTAKVQGYLETIDALRDSRMIDAGDAFGAKMMMGALSKEDPDTGKKILDLALSVQQQVLHVGPIALTKVPRVVW